MSGQGLELCFVSDGRRPPSSARSPGCSAVPARWSVRARGPATGPRRAGLRAGRAPTPTRGSSPSPAGRPAGPSKLTAAQNSSFLGFPSKNKRLSARFALMLGRRPIGIAAGEAIRGDERQVAVAGSSGAGARRGPGWPAEDTARPIMFMGLNYTGPSNESLMRVVAGSMPLSLQENQPDERISRVASVARNMLV